MQWEAGDGSAPDSPVPRAASTIAPMLGRCPPGKTCSRMKSEDLQYASYRSSGSAMTWQQYNRDQGGGAGEQRMLTSANQQPSHHLRIATGPVARPFPRLIEDSHLGD